MSETSQVRSSESRRPLKGIQVGVVTMAKQDKTRTVEVKYQSRHPKYGKYINRKTKYRVHDPKNVSQSGDRVEIANCRPISKSKTWRLVRVIESALRDEV